MPEATASPSLAERFWSHAPAAEPEPEGIPEAGRAVLVVKSFLAVLDHLRDAPVLAAMLRRAEVEGEQSYAAPEQLRGEPVDARSVIFSLGVLLFERLTGRHPFGAENNRARQVERIRRGEMGSGVNALPTISGALRSILVRAMSPFPEERWPDLPAFRKALEALVVEPEPSAAQPPKLPGTSDVGHEDQTRVLANPVQFGRDLMKVVADHDPPPTDPPRVAPPRTSSTARIAREELPPELRRTKGRDDDPTYRLPPEETRRRGRGGATFVGAILGAGLTLGVIYGVPLLTSRDASEPAVAAAPVAPAPVAAPQPAPEPAPVPAAAPAPTAAPATAATRTHPLPQPAPCRTRNRCRTRTPLPHPHPQPLPHPFLRPHPHPHPPPPPLTPSKRSPTASARRGARRPTSSSPPSSPASIPRNPPASSASPSSSRTAPS